MTSQHDDKLKVTLGLMAAEAPHPADFDRLTTVTASESVVRRSWSPAVAMAAGFAVVVMAVGAIALVGSPSSDSVGVKILEDGVVTQAEYSMGAQAVVACVTDAGFETEVVFDRPDGHASFISNSSGSESPDIETMDRCFDELDFSNVSLGWASAQGQVDLAEMRSQAIATVACIEERTGIDYGEVTYDEHDYVTREGQQTIDAAADHGDHRLWMSCRNDLGFLAEMHAEEQALVDCVEERTGQIFGEITYDDDGFHTPEGQEVVRTAIMWDLEEPWNACEQELGLGWTTDIPVDDPATR